MTDLETLLIQILISYNLIDFYKTENFNKKLSFTNIIFNLFGNEFFFKRDWLKFSNFVEKKNYIYFPYLIFNYHTPGHSSPVFINLKEKFFLFLDSTPDYLSINEMVYNTIKFLHILNLTENDNNVSEYKIHFFMSGNQIKDYLCQSYTLLFADKVFDKFNKDKTVINDIEKIIQIYKDEVTFDNIFSFYTRIKKNVLSEEIYKKYKSLSLKDSKEDLNTLKENLKDHNDYISETLKQMIGQEKEICFLKCHDKKKINREGKNNLKKKIEPVILYYTNEAVLKLFKVNKTWYFFNKAEVNLFGCNDEFIHEFKFQKDSDVKKAVKTTLENIIKDKNK